MERYPGERFYIWSDNGEPVGLCGFRILPGFLEICHIAVVRHAQKSGIGIT
ncbi:MAG: GNAT family N-acetyltransferase [Oscillospiraceae bacterium]|nr:GNAT family N-acetyltransferase [Oscillospiraceae bacterium]